VILKLFNYFLILFLLQSCSGGRIGNFLELSFRNIEIEESKSNQNNSNNQKLAKNKKNLKDSSALAISKPNKVFTKETKKINEQKKQKLKLNQTNNLQNKAIKKTLIQDQNKIIKRNYDPQSYRVIIILKEVDPTAPSQNFSNVLKKANILFEIEKIELFQENDLKN